MSDRDKPYTIKPMSSGPYFKSEPRSPSTKKTLFPIVEVFGHPWDATHAAAKAAFQQKWCPFTDTACEKYRQYGFGYCSVTYAAADDSGKSYTYAVCDHRLDGRPLAHVLADHFGNKRARLVPEIVLTEPRTSFDYVALDEDNTDDVIVIEAQAIDIRGGGVGPAWRAWVNGEVLKWREYFTEDAKKRERKDIVAYGVNMANIYKRLGLQVAVKGSYLKGIRVPFYVLMQDRPFQYLRRRISFEPSRDSEPWDITFITFEYDDRTDLSEAIPFVHRQTVRTTVANYISALASDPGMAKQAREDFLERVKRKAGLHK